MKRTIMITSGKGGTGKTMFAINFALVLSAMGHKTSVIDMSNGLRSLDLAAGVENYALYDISDVITKICSFKDILIYPDYDPEMAIIAACQDQDRADMILDKMQFVLRVLHDAAGFEFVILDCPPGVGKTFKRCADLADDAVIVLNPDYPSLRDADAVEDYIIRNTEASRSYVINSYLPEREADGGELYPDAVDERMRCDSLGKIKENAEIRKSMNDGVPAVLDRSSDIMPEFVNIAKKYLNSLGAVD